MNNITKIKKNFLLLLPTRKKSYIVIMITSLIFVVILFLYYFGKISFGDSTTKKIYCSVHLEIYKDDLFGQVKITYSIYENHGVVFIDGNIYKDKNSVGFISQRTSFEVKKVNDILLLSSNNTWVSEVNSINEEFISSVIPLFYTKKDNHMAIRFTQKTPDYYDISTRIVPSMYCSAVVK